MSGAVKHKAKLHADIVGDTAKARKGDGYSAALQCFTQSAEDYLPRLVSGISSGEGIIHAVRDGHEDEDGVIVDGMNDKRLMIVEPEFARVLRVMDRQGSTVSHVLRDSWDDKPLQITNKNTPEKATNHHISVVGHITAEELNTSLKRVEMATA